MTPWELAKDTEHSQQRALFAWANCAADHGFEIAARREGYSLNSRENLKYKVERSQPVFDFNPVPELHLLFAIHNQGHGDRIRGAQAKAEGVKAGVPDIMLPVRRIHKLPYPESHLNYEYAGLFVELKKLKKGVVSVDQKDWVKELSEQGYAVSICKGWIEAVNTIAGYLGSMVRIE
jgi:hypothetical protein